MNFVRSAGNVPVTRRLNEWKKPSVNWQILNVDASFSVVGNTGSCCAVVRDDQGSFMGASCCSTDHACDAEMMEALALREDLHLARRLACHNLVIQSDCIFAWQWSRH
jgi:hypothetical protein